VYLAGSGLLIKIADFLINCFKHFFLTQPTITLSTKPFISAYRHAGNFTAFILRLTPAGLYGLLGIPANEFKDQLIDCTLIRASLFAEITERLMGCNDIDSCVAVVEPYLMKMAGTTLISAPVDHMAMLISANRVPPAIKGLQEKVCLSHRQLERNFTKEVGITPKYYSRMIRFTNMLYYKMQYPAIKWPAVSYEFNYTDQTHLIRDFQHFLGITPNEFVPDNFACLEHLPPSLKWLSY
jgi:AraC-like DNA-binding protein